MSTRTKHEIFLANKAAREAALKSAYESGAVTYRELVSMLLTAEISLRLFRKLTDSHQVESAGVRYTFLSRPCSYWPLRWMVTYGKASDDFSTGHIVFNSPEEARERLGWEDPEHREAARLYLAFLGSN